MPFSAVTFTEVIDKDKYDEIMDKYLKLQSDYNALQVTVNTLTKDKANLERAYLRAKATLDEEAAACRRYSQQVDMYEKMFAKAQCQADNATELANRYKELVKQCMTENQLLTQRIKERAMPCDSSSSIFSQTTEETFK